MSLSAQCRVHVIGHFLTHHGIRMNKQVQFGRTYVISSIEKPMTNYKSTNFNSYLITTMLLCIHIHCDHITINFMWHFTIKHLTQPCVIVITYQMLGWKGLSFEVHKAFLWPLWKNSYCLKSFSYTYVR